MSDAPSPPIQIGDHTFERCATFPAFFRGQSSKSSSSEIELKMSVPAEGRTDAINLMDTDGEELRVVVFRRVWKMDDDMGDDDDEG